MIRRIATPRTERLLAAYGADPARWPARARDRKLANTAGALAAARALDAALDRLDAPPPDPLLAERVLAQAAGLAQEGPQVAVGRTSLALRLAAGWPEVAALAAAVLLGLVVGWSEVLPVGVPAGQDVVVISRLDGLE